MFVGPTDGRTKEASFLEGVFSLSVRQPPANLNFQLNSVFKRNALTIDIREKMDYDEDRGAFSPASSVASSSSSDSAASLASDNEQHEPFNQTYEYDRMSRLARRSYRDCYEDRLNQSLFPFRSLQSPVNEAPLPKATHKPEYDADLQAAFESAVTTSNASQLDGLLKAHSESVDVNRYDSEGRTPLQRFCGQGSLELAKLLVRYGADLNLRTREGWSLIHIASFSGSSDMVNFVLKNAKNNPHR